MTRDHLAVLRQCAEEIGETVVAGARRGFSGQRETQYHLDLAADEVALRVLVGAGYRVMSEESGLTGSGEYVVVIDPIDGSTNCDRGVPFFATSLAVVRENELVAGLVTNQATGVTYLAERGAGATRDGEAIRPSTTTALADAIVAFSGLPRAHHGWGQYRALGAASLEICLVADGSLDAYTVARDSALHPWDYLAGLLIANESGARASDLRDEPLLTTERVRRHPLFSATAELETAIRAIETL